MSTILVDQYGQPLTADPIGPMFGPTRFEDQPAYVRRRGRKGKALSSRRSSTRRSSRKSSSRRGRSSARSSNRRDYRKFLNKRAATFGPVRFEDQPGWIRRRGRKQTAGTARRGRKSAARTTRRSARTATGSSSREVRRLRREGAITRKQARKLNRQLARQKSKGGKSSSRSVTRRSKKSRGSKSLARSGPSKVLTYNSLMSQLKKRKGLKAWVCVGKKRTGCGGGRKGYRGSRQLGVLRP